MSVLQRKAQAGRQEHQARAMTVPKSLRLSVAKVADQLWGMAIAVIAISEENRDADSLEPEFSEDSLLLLLDGPDGTTGAAVVGRELAGALVQQQTIGRVTTQPLPERVMTTTDAALCAPLLDSVFARAHTLLEADEDRRALPILKFGARCENARLLKLALEEPEYKLVKMTVDIAGGAHQSNLTLVLPIAKMQEKPKFASEDGALAGKTTLEPVAMTLQAELKAILCNIRVPVSQFGALQAGMTLELPPNAFPDVRVEAIDGRVLAKGELGQVQGLRALRLEHRPMLHQNANRRASDQADQDQPDLSNGNMVAGAAFDIAASSDAADQLPDLDDLPAVNELPDLDHLPGLSGADTDLEIITPESLEKEAAMNATSGDDLPSDLPDLDDLPDLSDLPEFNDLPDIDDLPDLNTA